MLTLVCDVGVFYARNYPLWPVSSCQADALELQGSKSYIYFLQLYELATANYFKGAWQSKAPQVLGILVPVDGVNLVLH